MSSLEDEIEIPVGVAHSFDNRVPGISTYYGRDRGDIGENTTKHKSIIDFIESSRLKEYNYIFNEKTNKLQKLRSLLMKDREVSKETKDIIEFEIKKEKSEKEANKLSKKLNNKNKKYFNKPKL